MTKEEIHNIYLHMSGKAEGLVEATGEADFPVLFARAILEYSKKQWVGLTDEELLQAYGWRLASGAPNWILEEAKQELLGALRKVEAKLKERNI